MTAVVSEPPRARISPNRDLRDQIDIDCADFLNFIVGLHREFGIEIPDAKSGH